MQYVLAYTQSGKGNKIGNKEAIIIPENGRLRRKKCGLSLSLSRPNHGTAGPCAQHSRGLLRPHKHYSPTSLLKEDHATNFP